MKIYLVDGTYELFRAFFALPPLKAPDGRPVSAVRGLIQTLLQLLRQPDVTHLACAFDHGITSFRNDLFEGYKTGRDTPEELSSQFELAERASYALGIVTWPMAEFEADDALATAAAKWENDPEVEQIVICTPDKDLCQMVRGNRVVCLDRRKGLVLDEEAVADKFGVGPRSIPDYLALVGDSADAIPGIPRWGAKSTAAVLARYSHLEEIPASSAVWDVAVRGAKTMAVNLAQRRDDADLFKDLATLRTDAPIAETLDELRWQGAHATQYRSLCAELGFQRLADAPASWRGR